MKETVFSISELVDIATALAMVDADIDSYRFSRLEEKVNDLLSELRWQALMGK